MTPTKFEIGFPFKHNEHTRNGTGGGVGACVGVVGATAAGADGGGTTGDDGGGFDVGQPHRCCAAANACAVKH
eukprot:CAMPEP_0113501382 /NCGR_PEP_ID=MMETSP0014_2-20120614/32922_1 /TAXON_ID=2857 /ORGANISM="Nitzschia sp." /LENGTH=72 /DNA_ID=CAMNT_0000395961 /DNA_START=256 /DNA_END=474 /DNA_ORIENTATION=- /assembly_acc=CAM_ASM_000159